MRAWTYWLRNRSLRPSAAGERLADLAESKGRILQVGHLERFNPAVMALEGKITVPLFFEIHRLSVFSPRSLDVDVVLDLMIHDLDIVLSITGQEPSEYTRPGSPCFRLRSISRTSGWFFRPAVSLT